MTGNPVTQTKDYRGEVTFMLVGLSTLDCVEIGAEDRVLAVSQRGGDCEMLKAVENRLAGECNTTPDWQYSDGNCEHPTGVKYGSAKQLWCRLAEAQLLAPWEEFIALAESEASSERTNISTVGIAVGEPGLRAVADVIEGCENLKVVDLMGAVDPRRWSTVLSDHFGVRAVLRALETRPIERLTLQQCQLDHTVGKHLATFLKTAPQLTHLDLADNFLGSHI